MSRLIVLKVPTAFMSIEPVEMGAPKPEPILLQIYEGINQEWYKM